MPFLCKIETIQIASKCMHQISLNHTYIHVDYMHGVCAEGRTEEIDRSHMCMVRKSIQVINLLS